MDQLPTLRAESPRGAAGRPPQLGAEGLGGVPKVKICGCTSVADVAAAVAAGADAVGLIFAPSPRRVTTEQARLATAAVPAGVSVVGVFVDPSPSELERVLAVLPRLTPQFSGSEPPELCRYLGVPYLKVFPVPTRAATTEADLAAALERYPEALPIFETASQQRGGSGRSFDWSLVSHLVELRAAVISGGLDPSNVGECVRQLQPYAVDVRSGVEADGVKDPAKLADFINQVRRAHATS